MANRNRGKPSRTARNRKSHVANHDPGLENPNGLEPMSHQNEFAQQLLEHDPRFSIEAYEFVRDALEFAQEELGLGESLGSPGESHLSGQQLCESIRQYGIEQYGYMAKVVLNSWGVRSTGDFGDVVYNLITIGLMKKSKSDRREDFDDCFDFEEAFQRQFEITPPE